MAPVGWLPTLFTRKDARWQEQSAGHADAMPCDVPLHVNATLLRRLRRLLSDLSRSLSSRPSHEALLLPDRGNASRLPARVLRSHPCIGASSHEPYLSTVLEPYQRAVDRRV
jgi:hypothetical protein